RATAVPSRGRPGSRRRGRGAATPASAASGTGRAPGTPPPARGSRASARPPRARRPTARAAARARARCPAARARRPAPRPPAASPGGAGREGAPRRARVLRRRPDDLVVGVLLEHVRGPAGDAAGGEQRREELVRNAEVTVDRAGVEVDVRVQPLRLLH